MHSNVGHQMALNGHLHAVGALFPGKATVLPLGSRRNGFQRWSGCYSEEKNCSSCPACGLVTMRRYSSSHSNELSIYLAGGGQIVRWCSMFIQHSTLVVDR
jgi:hypothetical protein